MAANRKNLRMLLKDCINRDLSFAFTGKSDRNLEEVLVKKHCRASRIEAEQGALEEFYSAYPEDKRPLEVLLKEKTICVWDLKVELQRRT